MALAALCCVSTCMPGQDDLTRDYDGKGKPGASVLVLHDGEIVFRRSYGLADLESGLPSTPSTHYRLASVSKQFTAAAVMTLADRGKLSYDDPVRKVLPSLPAWADQVTVRHLLTHTSGIVDYEDLLAEGASARLQDADVLRLLEGQTGFYFPAGAGYRYSNSGYALLALVVERVSGLPFADFLRQEIFSPLGMKTTVAHVEGVSTVPDRAYGYSREGAQWKRTDQSVTSTVLGDGGIYSSIDELTPWLIALDRGRYAMSSEPMVATDSPGVRYGFGWRSGEHGGRRVVSHTGETIGFRNAIVRFPDQRLSVVVLTNRSEGEPYQAALTIADRFFAGK